jgi:hypothetical protein
MSCRDGVPLSRYLEADVVDSDVMRGSEVSLPPLTIIGAPPLTVSTGAPGARGEVRAYVARVGSTADELQAAFKQWLKVKWSDVPPDDQKPPTADETDFIVHWPPWYGEWSAWVVKLDTFDVFGPTPNEAWMKTEIYDGDLEVFRKQFARLAVGTSVKVPDGGKDPGGTGGHEEPGGVKQPGVLDALGISDALGGVVTVVVAIAVAAVAIVLVKR